MSNNLVRSTHIFSDSEKITWIDKTWQSRKCWCMLCTSDQIFKKACAVIPMIVFKALPEIAMVY